MSNALVNLYCGAGCPDGDDLSPDVVMTWAARALVSQAASHTEEMWRVLTAFSITLNAILRAAGETPKAAREGTQKTLRELGYALKRNKWERVS